MARPHSTRVDSLTNYNHSEAFGDDLVVAPLVEDAGSLTDADLTRIEGVALNAVEIAGRLVSTMDAWGDWRSTSPCRKNPTPQWPN